MYCVLLKKIIKRQTYWNYENCNEKWKPANQQLLYFTPQAKVFQGSFNDHFEVKVSLSAVKLIKKEANQRWSAKGVSTCSTMNIKMHITAQLCKIVVHDLPQPKYDPFTISIKSIIVILIITTVRNNVEQRHCLLTHDVVYCAVLPWCYYRKMWHAGEFVTPVDNFQQK